MPPAKQEQQRRRRKADGIYEQKIRLMCASNKGALQVSYHHLMEAEPLLAVWLADAPKDMLDLLDETESTCQEEIADLKQMVSQTNAALAAMAKRFDRIEAKLGISPVADV